MKKRPLLCIFAVGILTILFLSACGQKAKPISSSGASAPKSPKNAETLYNDFLFKDVAAKDKQGKSLKADDVKTAGAKYTFYDMNGDREDELLIKSDSGLKIFWVKDGNVTLWHEATSYTEPLNNGTLLSKRSGGAPKHTDYVYTILNYSGDELFSEQFSEYETSAKNGQYFIGDAEVDKAVYEKVAEPVLNLQSDKIIWKSIQ